MLARRSLLRRGAARVVFVVISLALTACQSASLPSFTAAPITPSMKSEQQSLKTASLTIVPSPVAPSPTPAPSTTPTVAPTPVPSPTTKPTAIVVDFSKVHPNELGVIPIMEYHLIGDADARWSRSWQHFRGDLERLYQAGYRTVPLQDVIDDRIDVPAGYSPVVLTFDDSSPGQFTLVEQNGKLVPDPHCAVGILDAFYREHRDFGEHATFFVLPAADPPHNLFGQDQYQKQKLDYLVAHGMEIGNHTYWHQNLSEVGDAEVKRQIGQAVQVIDTLVPGYDVDLFALPQSGAGPVTRSRRVRRARTTTDSGDSGAAQPLVQRDGSQSELPALRQRR